ncbi:MAG TPA: hypothetical protein VKB65_12395 [Myxococcota bacterium]|nr:hypothetical protein [Myxococcota bacterium]
MAAGARARTAGTRAPGGEWRARAIVAALAVLYTLGAFLPDWLSQRRFDGDHAQHVWWTARFADPGLFPGDFIADFFSLPIFAPIGWQTVMRLGVELGDPQRVAETIPFLLGPWVVWLAWRAGRAASGGPAGGVVAALAAPMLFGPLEGGMPRAFGTPVLLLAVVGLLEGRLAWVGVAGLAAALFYPPVAINLGLTAGVVLGLQTWRERRLPKGWPALAAFGAVAVCVVLWAYATPVPEGFGPRLTRAEAETMAEFGPNGRSALFTGSALRTAFGRGRGGYGIAPAASLTLAALVAISVRTLPRFLPTAAWALIGSAMLAHAAAWATLFTLHLPLKYMRYALPLFALLWLASVAPVVGRRLAARFPALARPRWLLAGALALLLADAVVTLRSLERRIGAEDYRARTQMHRFLRKLPVDALIAAHPEDANAIPLVSKRSVLASKEVALPYYRGYYERVAERLEASLRAHYALDWETVDSLYDRYGVDAMVVHEHRFQPDARDFDEPFASRLGDALHAERDRYVLTRPPPDRVLYRNDAFWVVRLGPPRPGYPAREGRKRPIAKAPAAAGTR